MSADLKGLVATGANLGGVRLQRSRLEDADLSGARFDDTEFVMTSLARVRFDGAEANNLRIFDCDLHQVSFAKARLENLNLMRSEGEGVSFVGAELNGCNFIDMKLPKVSFEQGSLEGCVFLRSELEAGTLPTTLSNTRFEDTAIPGRPRAKTMQTLGEELEGQGQAEGGRRSRPARQRAAARHPRTRRRARLVGGQPRGDQLARP